MRRKCTILIVDSSESYCIKLSQTLSTEQDMEVVGTATDGEEALNLTAKLHPDVLVMDLALRKVNGIGVLNRLRKIEVPPKIMVVSALNDNTLIRRCALLGVAYYLINLAILSF